MPNLYAIYPMAVGGDNPGGFDVMLFMPMVVLIFVFYFFMIRPQRKRDKAQRDMRSRLEVGDEVVTIGGIIGTVVSIHKDTDTLIIETGGDRSKIRITRTAVQTNNTVHDDTPA